MGACQQGEYEAKTAKRKSQREVGKKPRGKDPEPPQAGPKDGDQVNLTDEESRIMPFSGGSFEQSYNAQAGVDTETMMVITRHVSQASNDKREVVPTLEQIQSLPAVLGEVQSLITDNGFFSQANVIACHDAGVEPLLALKRESHHMPVMERFASDAKLARAAGLAPIPVSSGNTNRHRLDRGGNRQINAAIHRIAVTRARCHPETRTYLDRKRAEGKTSAEAIRCLKRHLTRRIWHLLQPPHPGALNTNPLT